ncbi:MAG: TonB-dependent receptor [Crocinitomicaceae bacterium]|nr:TonB-dependent receptor [Crocinitomicaceae bacterium]MDP4955051.1 TonB-dependent receptor [Crocinitomicaceae bacterium]
MTKLDAQNLISITGKVLTYEQSKPLEYVSLKLYKLPDSSFVKGSFSNPDGKFQILASPGKYYLKLSVTLYEDELTESFELKPTQANLHLGTLRMQKPKTQETKEVVVRGQKEVMETGIDKKVYNVAEDLNVNGGTANDILNRLPSVEVDQDGGVLLRGQGSVTILIDGRPSSMSGGNGKTLLDALPANSIERVEIVTNPSAKYDPDGTSGIINIVLKKNKLLGFNGLVSTNLASGDLSGGNVGEGSVSLSYRNGNINVFGTYNARYLEGYRNNYNDIRQELSSGVFILDQNRTGTDLNAGQTFRVGTDINLNLRNTIGFVATGSLTQRDRTGDLWNAQMNEDGTITNLWKRSSIDPTDRQNLDLNLNYKHDFKNERGNLILDVNQSLGTEDIEGYYVNTYYNPDTTLSTLPILDQRLFNTDKNNITTAQADLTYLFPNLGLRTEAGVKAILRDQLVDTYSETLDNLSNTYQEDTLANFLYGYKEQVYSVYGVAGKQVKRFKLQAGLRAEKAYQIPNLISDTIRIVNDYFNFFPSAHVRYELKPKSELSLSYSRRIKRAGADELNPFTNYSDPFNLRRGNPYLSPEYIHSFDLSYSLEKKKLNVSSALFFRQSDGVISRFKEFYPDNTSAVTFMNIAQTKALGAELVLMFKPSPSLRSTISYNGNYTWYLTNQAELPNRQGFNNNVKWNTSYEFWKKTATLQLSVNYNGPRVTVQGIAQRKGPIDLAFEKKLAKGNWSIGTRVTDIFDRQGFYYEVDRPGILQTGEFKWLTRRVYVSASYKFGKLEVSNKGKQSGSDGGGEL